MTAEPAVGGPGAAGFLASLSPNLSQLATEKSHRTANPIRRIGERSADRKSPIIGFRTYFLSLYLNVRVRSRRRSPAGTEEWATVARPDSSRRRRRPDGRGARRR